MNEHETHSLDWNEDPFETPPGYEPGEEPSAFDRFVMVFTDPREAFSGLTFAPNRGSIIIWGIVIGLIVTVLGTAIITKMPETAELQRQRVSKQLDRLEQQYEEGKMTKEQYDGAKKVMSNMTGSQSIWPYLFAGLSVLILWLIGTLVLWAVARVLETGAETNLTFGVAFSTYMIASMIPIGMKILYTVMSLVTRDPIFTLSPALFVSDKTSYLATVLSMFDVSVIWWIIATGIGIATISGNKRTGKAIAIWATIVFVILGGLAALGAVFSG